MESDRLSLQQRKLMKEAYEARLLTEIDSCSVQAQVKGERKDLFIIDVRDVESFADGHIPGAVNIPYEEIEKRFRAVPKDKIIVVYCWSAECMLAPRSALKLSQLEIFPRIMRTGWEEWVGHKKPVERSSR